jgi:hypothetical protein
VLNRARGELVADGFEVQIVDPMPNADRLPALARRGRATGAAVTAGLFIADDASTIEMTLVDGLSNRVLTRRLEVRPNSPEQAPEVLARRAVDLLRASLLELLVASLRSAVSEARVRPAASAPIEPRDDRRDPVSTRWAIEAGLGVLASLDGLGPAIVPLARVRYAMGETFQLRVTGAWLGTQPRVEASAGSATVEQGIGLVEAVARLRQGWLYPFVSLGLGGYYVAVNGSGAAPRPGARSSDVAAAFDAGLGLAAAVGVHVEVVVETHALVTAPGIAVRFVDSDVARVGRPSLLGAISLAGWL